MLVLGIESSCDETAAAVVTREGRVLSDVVESQIRLHAEYGGVVPELASRDHMKNIGTVVTTALESANVKLSDVNAIAVTNRPGLVGALLVGVQAAKGLAWGAQKPIVGVDHLVGHLLAIFLKRDDRVDREIVTPEFPFVALLVSGGHTALYRVNGPLASDVSELGATRDDAAGEAFDKVAKMLGLGYPGGPRIDKLAATGNPNAHTFSVPMPQKGNLEFSFSGIKTQVARFVAEHGIPKSDQAMADLCASFQSTVTGTLARKLIAAARQERVRSVVIGGGVAANRELRTRVTAFANDAGLQSFVPAVASCTDNAAMIAYAGAMRFSRGERDGFDLVAKSATALPRVTRKGRGER